MANSLDNLLTSCSLASRSIRLLTAETKRRAELLRACCSEYDVALAKLSAARLDGLRQDAQQQLEREHAIAEASTQQEAEQGRSHGAHVTSATPAMSTRVGYQESSADGAATPQSAPAASEQRPGHGHGHDHGRRSVSVSVNSCASDAPDESLRITESLEEILEQARSIRTSDSLQRIGTGGGGGGGGDGGRATSASSASSSNIRSGGGGLHSNASFSTTPQATMAVAMTPRVHSKAGAVATGASPVSGASPRSCISSSPSASTMGVGRRQLHRQTDPVPGHQSRVHNTGAAGKVSKGTTAAASSHSSSRRYASGPRESERTVRRTGARRARSSSSQSSVTPPECPEFAGRQKQGPEQEQEAVEYGEEETEVASNLKSGMWEEVARYEAARRGFVGLYDSSSNSNSNRGFSGYSGDSDDSTGGGAVARSSRHDFEGAEEMLLRQLDLGSGSGDSSSGGQVQGENFDQTRPDPQLLQLRQLLLSGHEREPQVSVAAERDFRSRDHDGHGADSGEGVRPGVGVGEDGEGNAAGGGEPTGLVGLDRLGEVIRLQRSLVMLLDELEGRRELRVHELEQGKRNVGVTTSTRGGKHDHGRAGFAEVGDGGAGGMGMALRDLEDWYGRNKVAHVTCLLRERLDAIRRDVGMLPHDNCAGGDNKDSLSQEVQKLIDNPALALGEESPLPPLSDPHHGPDDHDGNHEDNLDHGWLMAWLQSSGAHVLRGSACSRVVQELQASAPSCWPHDSDSEHGQTAELFVRQLRMTSVLAAETDVSRLVIPALALELSQASQASQASQGSVQVCGCLAKMDPVSIASESSFDSDYCWDIDEQVDEEGESSEEEEPCCVPLPLVAETPSSAAGHNGGKQETGGGATMKSESEGTGRHEDGRRSRIREGARVSRERIAKLWSKLRAVAYITSLQDKIKTLWSLATSGGEGCDPEASLSKGDFLSMMVKIHVLIIYPPVDLSWAMTNAMKDWEKDNAGLETMNLHRFVDSMFELVDIWTETTEESEYLEMLDLLTQGITKEIPRIGSLCWKPVEEIRYDPRITKVALTMADVVDRVDVAESSSTAVDHDPREGATLSKLNSFVQMKQASNDRAGKGRKVSSPVAKDLRPSFALGRWQKAVSVALVVSKTGNSGGLHHYIKSGKNKHGLIKGDKLLLNIVKIYKAKQQRGRLITPTRDAVCKAIRHSRFGRRRENVSPVRPDGLLFTYRWEFGPTRGGSGPLDGVGERAGVRAEEHFCLGRLAGFEECS
eukprot:g10109.t1